jgi:hypothetical protein
MHPNPQCLDCAECSEACDTCAFVSVRYKWQLYHGTDAPPRLWLAAIQWGGRYVYTTLKRKGFRVDVKVFAPKLGNRWPK